MQQAAEGLKEACLLAGGLLVTILYGIKLSLSILLVSCAVDYNYRAFIRMDRQQAQKLYEEGAFLVLLDVPQNTEIGIDYNSWQSGPKFMGIKMIPPGIHYVYYRYAE